MRTFIEQRAASLYEPLLGPILRGLRQEVYDVIYDHVLKDQVADVSSLRPVRILDCCCGAGGFLDFLQHKSKQLNHVFCFGLDLSPAMLHAAQKRLHKSHQSAEQKHYIIQGDALQLPLATQSVTVATLCMALHTLPVEQGRKLIQELLRVASNVIVADYCLAERNLHVPSTWLAHGVECLVGGEHYATYKEFMGGGALEGFCHTEGLIPQARRFTLGGAGQVVLLHSSKSTDFS